MRLSNTQAVSRPVYYDRNPIVKLNLYGAAGIAPHADTTRWSYTVPTGRKAFIEALFTQMHRQAVAAPVGEYYVRVQYLPFGASAANVIFLGSQDNTAVNYPSLSVTNFGFMLAGDVLQANTSDASTGGTVSYTVNGKGGEFDA